MAKLPTVSIVIPNYNHGQYLAKCLNAYLAQSVQPDEIIVIDDGSTDNSVEVVGEFTRKYPTIHLYKNDVNRGVNFTCNRGLELAKCDFVGVLAADDEVLPGFLEKSLRLLAEHPTAGLCGTISEYKDMATGATWYLGAKLTGPPSYYSPETMVGLCKRDLLQISTSSMLARREAFLAAGKYLADLKWHSDWFALIVMSFRHGVCFVPEPLAQFCIYPASFSNKGRRRTKEQVGVLRAILTRLDEPQYADVAPYCAKAALLAPFGKEMLWLLLTNRRYWKHISFAYLKNAIKWTARVEGRKILPKPVANLILKVAGFKKLPKAQSGA